MIRGMGEGGGGRGKKMGGRGGKGGKKAEAGDSREGVRRRKGGRKTGSQGRVVGGGGGRRKWVRRRKLRRGQVSSVSCLLHGHLHSATVQFSPNRALEIFGFEAIYVLQEHVIVGGLSKSM